MSNNRTLGNLAQLLDSAASGSAISKRNGSIGTIAMADSDVGGVASTGFTDSNLIKNIIDINHITKVGRTTASSDGLKAILQGNAPTTLNPSASATYNLGDSSNPIDEIILDSSATIYFGDISLTSILKSGTSNIITSVAAGAVWYGDRGLMFFGYYGGSTTSVNIDYFDITSSGNATDFGDLTIALRQRAAVGDGTYGVSGAGYDTAANNTMDYIITSTTGNATDFGDLTVARYATSGVMDGTTGLFGGGQAATNTIDSITIATPSNATDFGDLTVARGTLHSSSNSTYGVFAGGSSNTIDYVTIASSGNAADFGDLLASTTYESRGVMSDETYGVLGGGYAGGYQNVIEYITFASPANSTDFGDLTVARRGVASTGNASTGVFMAGREDGTGRVNKIEYITIATPGNAADFGDLTNTSDYSSGISGSPS